MNQRSIHQAVAAFFVAVATLSVASCDSACDAFKHCKHCLESDRLECMALLRMSDDQMCEKSRDEGELASCL